MRSPASLLDLSFLALHVKRVAASIYADKTYDGVGNGRAPGPAKGLF